MSFLRSTRPKVVLTVIDNSRDLYSARVAIAEMSTRFVIFQNGNRWLVEFPSEPALKPVNIFFCLTQAYLQPLRKTAVGAASLIPSGTLASKLHTVKAADFSDHTTAGYISNWRQGEVLNGELWTRDAVGEPVLKTLPHMPEHELLPFLLASLSTLGMKLEIIGGPPDSRMDGLLVCQKILGHEGWTFSPRIENKRSYGRLHQHPILFCVDSTLGYEALCLLRKVMFLDTS